MNWLSQIFGFFKAFQLWVTIAPWELALRVRLGKTAVRLGPGVHFRIPFLDRIFVQCSRVRPISDSGQTITTDDGKVLSIAVVVTYAISDMLKLYETVSNPESMLLFEVQALLSKIISSSSSAAISPLMLEEAVSSKLPSVDWGLDHVKLKVTTFAYVRTYRILNYEYRSLSSANELEIAKV